MKLGEALLCCNCDELFPVGPSPVCPACTSLALVPLKRFIMPNENPAPEDKRINLGDAFPWSAEG